MDKVCMKRYSEAFRKTVFREYEAGETAVDTAVNVNNPGALQVYVRLEFVTNGRRARYERRRVT